MKLYVFILVLSVVLVQAIFSQATLTQSSSDNNNLKRMSSAWGKRMSSAWGKRMSSAWGKRAESESDELYNNIIRELYLQARRNKNDHSRFSIGNAANPFGLDQFLAQRSVATNNNNDDEAVDQDAS